MKKLNLNSFIKVKLNDRGKDIYYHRYDELNEWISNNNATPIAPQFPEVDEDGYSTFLLWDFMNLYGKYMAMGAPNVIEPLNIYIEAKDLEEV